MPLPLGHSIRRPRESDYAVIMEAIPRWWRTPNANRVGDMLPRLFLQHFTDTSWLIEAESGELGAFLIGFYSPSKPEVAYIHFVGVDPELRGTGVARMMYELFFEEAKDAGRSEVRAVTGPFNAESQAFHTSLGFTMHGDTSIDGVMAYEDYDGPGDHRVTMSRPL